MELEPYPGRLAGSLRDTLGVGLAVLVAMTLRVPGISLALALLFLMQRERPGLTLRVALQILSGAAVACGASLLWVQLTDGTDVARFLGVALGIFVASFCIAATRLPLFWTIFAFYGFVDLSAWDAHRSANGIVASSLYNLASLGIVVACAVGIEYLFGTRHPAVDLQDEMKRRALSLSRFFRALGRGTPEPGSEEFRSLRHAIVQYANAGDFRLNELYDRIRDSSGGLANLPLAIHYRIGLLARVMEKSLLLGFRRPQQEDEEYRRSCLRIADLCDALANEAEVIPFPLSLPESTPGAMRDIVLELRQYAAALDQQEPGLRTGTPVQAQPRRSFQPFLPGAFDEPFAAHYALKLTLAATSCYILYNAVAWPGILTCVVTVLFTGLTSTGVMRQKQLYRFAGAAIGGLLGIATVSLLFPNMDSITSLIVAIAPIALLSGWVLRSPRIGYVGVQIAFGYFLTALPGFSAAVQISPARDRVFGIALGILVMWFVFDQLWPTRTSDALERSLLLIRNATKALQGIQTASTNWMSDVAFPGLRTSVSVELANVQQLEFAARFESGRHRKRELARSRRLVRKIEFAAADFYHLATRPSSN